MSEREFLDKAFRIYTELISNQHKMKPREEAALNEKTMESLRKIAFAATFVFFRVRLEAGDVYEDQPSLVMSVIADYFKS